ncbi:MAG: hypothetical protein FRX49_04049 [Trebouxia sp. A1-2]|nr:MAG: hypothetical protein FRX49_04049 [Trebouxia sp. A1-2]
MALAAAFSSSDDSTGRSAAPAVAPAVAALHAPGINAIMAFACIAAQFRAASQGNSAAHSRQAGSTAHNRQAGRRRQHRSSQQHTGKLLNT